jgi:hypothetical protein
MVERLALGLVPAFGIELVHVLARQVLQLVGDGLVRGLTFDHADI